MHIQYNLYFVISKGGRNNVKENQSTYKGVYGLYIIFMYKENISTKNI